MPVALGKHAHEKEVILCLAGTLYPGPVWYPGGFSLPLIDSRGVGSLPSGVWEMTEGWEPQMFSWHSGSISRTGVPWVFCCGSDFFFFFFFDQPFQTYSLIYSFSLNCFTIYFSGRHSATLSWPLRTFLLGTQTCWQMLYGPNIPSFFILAVFLMAWLWKPRLVLQIVIPTLLKGLMWG